MTRNRRSRSARLLTAFVVATLAVAALAAAGPATAGPVTSRSTGSHAPQDPWNQQNYTPTPGNWQPYVLAPTGHTVRPTSVLSADARGGSIIGSPADALGNHGSVRLVSKGARTSSPLLILDFGQEVGGEISIHVTGASATRPQLHVCFSESQADMALTPTQNGGEAAYAPGCDTANIWNGYPGQPYTYDADSHTLPLAGSTHLPATVTDTQPRGGFRYATIFLDGAGSVDLNDVSLDFQAAPQQSDPADYQGWFLSSDNELNKLWYAGAYTVQMDTWMSDTAKSWPYTDGEPDQSDSQVPYADPTKEVILDGAKRDRVVWQGDLAVEAPVTYLSTGDVSAVDNSLSSLAAQQLPDGYVPAESLVGQHNLDEIRTYGEYVTWFVYNEYEHWLYTGDLAYLQANWSRLMSAVGWLESVRAQDPQGLISFGSVGSCGHYGYSDCGHETYINALYARNLQQMAQLAGVLGDSASASTYSARAVTLAHDINTQLWDPKVGAYRLSRETPNVYPQDANATAVLTGVASPAQSAAALAYLRKNDWSTYGALTVSPGATGAPMPSTYEPLPSGFEAEARLTQNDSSGISQLGAEQLLDTYWGYQLTQDPGSTYWEKLDTTGSPSIDQFTSLAHGWASAPTIALTNDVLGVAPTTGGYASYDVVPRPGDVSWAQGVVPTPKGDISTSWRAQGASFTLQTSAPHGSVGRLAVPTGGAKVIVRLDDRVVWNGTRAVNGAKASSANGYVYVSGVGGGRHTLASTRVSALPTTLAVVSTPTNASTTAGGTATVTAAISGRADGQLRVTVGSSAPTGWTITPTSRSARSTITMRSNDKPVSSTQTFAVHVPQSAAPGSYPVTITATAAGHVVARDSVTISVTPPGYDFDTGTMGWQAGQNASGVAAVTSFADRPGTCVSVSCLQVVGAAAPATAVRSASVTPSTPIDMSGASAFTLQLDAYGGVPDATGYQAVVTLTSTDGSTRTNTYPVSSDTWNSLSLNLVGWSGAKSVSKIEVGFQAVGTTYTPWSADFQLDDVTWS